MSCGVGRRHSSDPALLWLWRRPTATALSRPLAWEPPHAVGTALEKTKKKMSIPLLLEGISCTYLIAVKLQNTKLPQKRKLQANKLITN